MLSFLEECRDDPELASVFTLAELVQMYSNRLQELGVELSSKINATRLKEPLFYVFPDLQAYNEGRNVKLIFNKDIGTAIRKPCEYDSDDDAVHLAKAAQIIRRDIFKTQRSFNGTFSPKCQEESLPTSLLTLINLILVGSNIQKHSTTEDVTKASSLAISQLLIFNSVKRSRDKNTAIVSRHIRERECPLPIYLALKIHGETRKRSLVDAFFNIGLCISYDRLLTISTDMANSVCSSFEEDGVVCPPKLRNQVFTTAAVDNIDHNPSSTTSSDSFHGTAISLVQHPTVEETGIDRCTNVIDGAVKSQQKLCSLPDAYANVPAASLPKKQLYASCVPEESMSVTHLSEGEGGEKMVEEFDGTHKQRESDFQRFCILCSFSCVQANAVKPSRGHHLSHAHVSRECALCGNDTSCTECG